MAKAYASTIIDAPVEAVWAMVRDFNGLPSWVSAIADTAIEDGQPADAVGCVRSMHLQDGTHLRERLLSLDDCTYSFSYNFEKPAFPVGNYHAEFRLIPVTDGDRTFAEWRSTFDERPEDAGKYEDIISNAVFSAGLASLREKARGRAVPAGEVRWQGARPAKVFCSAVIRGSIDAVWARMRDFTGMPEWHPEIHSMHMLEGKRSDQVGATRAFGLGDEQLHEVLTRLSDTEHEFRYRMTKGPQPWLNYHAGARLRPVSADGTSFAVWTADWTASPNDDVTLIPTIHEAVFQRAFDTLNERFFRG